LPAEFAVPGFTALPADAFLREHARRIARALPDLLARALFHQRFFMQQISVMPRGRFTQLGGWLSIGAMLSGEK